MNPSKKNNVGPPCTAQLFVFVSTRVIGGVSIGGSIEAVLIPRTL